MRKRQISLLIGLIAAFIFSFYQFVLADGAGIRVTPTDTTLTGFGKFSQEYGELHEDPDPATRGSYYNLSTTFVTWSTIDSSSSSTSITADADANTITVNVDGTYVITAHGTISACSCAEVTLATFLNVTSQIDDVTRKMTVGPHYHPTFSNLSAGATVSSGAITDLTMADGSNWVINESAQTPGFIIDFGFKGVTTPGYVQFTNTLYDGAAGHLVEAQAWNYDTSTWVNMRSATGDFPDAGGVDAYRYYERLLKFPTPMRSYAQDSNGEVKVRIIHTSGGSATHDMYFDYVELVDNQNAIPFAFQTILPLNSGDTLQLKMKANQGGISLYSKNMGLNVLKVGE